MPVSTDLNNKLSEALQTLREVVLEGLEHGHFEYSIRCEMKSGDKRSLVIIAGKSYKFLIPPDDLQH